MAAAATAWLPAAASLTHARSLSVLALQYYMDKHVMDRFIENHFDAAHNTFESIRRVADIYEW